MREGPRGPFKKGLDEGSATPRGYLLYQVFLSWYSMYRVLRVTRPNVMWCFVTHPNVMWCCIRCFVPGPKGCKKYPVLPGYSEVLGSLVLHCGPVEYTRPEHYTHADDHQCCYHPDEHIFQVHPRSSSISAILQTAGPTPGLRCPDPNRHIPVRLPL